MKAIIDLSHIFIIRKSEIAYSLMFVGMLTAFFGSLSIWFLWPLGAFYTVVADFFLVLSFIISFNWGRSLYCITHLQIATFCFFLFQIYTVIVNGKNINAVIMAFFDTGVIFFLMALTGESRQRLADTLSKTIGAILLVSIPFYMLWILDFPLPSVTIASENGVYIFSNYFFFLTDATNSELFPRFRSIFLEPGHVGTVCALLLYTQTGKWRKWYCVMMLIALLISFSLAAYVIFVMVIFLQMWIKRKHIALKLLGIGAMLAAFATGAYFYNDGHNLVNELILARLEINDEGKLAGDNRVTETFENQFDEFMKSDDVLTGRDFQVEKFGSGNSGYRVFIYDFGLLGVLFALLFYLSFVIDAKDKRAVLSMFLVTFALFWERATPMAFYNIIPLFIVAYWQRSEIEGIMQDTTEGLQTDAEETNKENHSR